MHFLEFIIDYRYVYVHGKRIRNGKKHHVTKALNILKILSNLTDRLTFLQIYGEVLRPKLDHGSQLYYSEKPNILNPLNSIHHFAISLSTEAFRSSLVQSLYVDAWEIFLQDRRSLEHFIRLHRLSESPASKAACVLHIQRHNFNNNRIPILFHIRIEQPKDKLIYRSLIIFNTPPTINHHGNIPLHL